MNLAEQVTEGRRLSRLIDQGVQALIDASRDAAEAEQEYRKSKGQAWITAPDGTVPEKEAWVNQATAKQRYARDLADGMRLAALEALRSRRQQLSFCQTVVNAHREDEAFHRTGPVAV
jgi:hypothetical protein